MLRHLWLSLVLVCALASCGSTPTTSPQQQVVDGITIELSAVAQPRLNEAQEFRIGLRDAAGQPITDAQVYLVLDMPAMPMGTNQPIATPTGDGSYLAQSAYTMTGDWILTVVAKVDGVEHRASFTRAVVQ